MVKIQAERLPDLNIPRVGHHTLYVNGELIVFGGHTTGFIPTATAEYLREGKWHTMQMTYPHDNGLAVRITQGKILVAGGHKDNLGIGQTFEAELYDIRTHTFGNYGCMDMKRTMLSGLAIDSGRVVISGNWYAPDGIEMYDGKGNFSFVKNVSVGRFAPYILRAAENDVLIFGSYGTRGQSLGDSAAIIDRLCGEPFMVPLLQRWKPVGPPAPLSHNSDKFIANVSGGIFSYLFLASNKDSLALMMARDTVFSLLPTVAPIPQTSSVGGRIIWQGPVIVDSSSQQAYIIGVDSEKRLYILCIEYTSQPAPLTVYYTEPLPDFGFNIPVLTADGDIAIVGGNAKTGFQSTNYEPTASAWLIHVGSKTANAGNTLWGNIYIWLCGVAALVIVAALIMFIRSRRSSSKTYTLQDSRSKNLMLRIRKLMEQEQLFRNSDLKAADVASALATNTYYVTSCIKTEQGQTFSQFVNGYRVEYVKEQLRKKPDEPVSLIYMDAGFSSERSFFRIFKEATGMTTREWLSQQ
jgi:AraC-like DNA-binding protein